MAEIIDIAAARAARPGPYRPAADGRTAGLRVFPFVVARRGWLIRESYRIRAGVGGATYRAIYEHVDRLLRASGVPAALADREARECCDFVRDRVNVLFELDGVDLYSAGLPPTPNGGRRA